MVPLHESDVAENRWKESEWNAYELWEAVEVRARKRKFWIVGLSCVLGFLILALPIYQEKMPKWKGLRVARILADHLLDIRRDSSNNQRRFLVKIQQDVAGRIQGNVYSAATAADCTEAAQTNIEPVFSFPLITEEQSSIALLTREAAQKIGLGAVDEAICFDPFRESEGSTMTFAFIPVKDLTDVREDRISTVTVLDAASFSFD